MRSARAEPVASSYTTLFPSDNSTISPLSSVRNTVTPYYDPLLGKLIVFAATREEALRKMKAALCELVIEGVPNNIEEQIALLSSSAFMTGDYDLDFIAK